MQYLQKSFKVVPGESKAFRDNFDAVFGKKSRKSAKKPATKPKKKAG